MILTAFFVALPSHLEGEEGEWGVAGDAEGEVGAVCPGGGGDEV